MNKKQEVQVCDARKAEQNSRKLVTKYFIVV